MRPVTPIIPGKDLPVTEIAKNQAQYLTLPAYKDAEGVVVSRWHCKWWERLRILVTGDLYLVQMTFNQKLQPVLLDTEPPHIGCPADN
jgi:hypothetical protein